MAGLLNKILKSMRSSDRKMSCCAIIVAAGDSRRMEGENKIFMPLNGVPVLARSILAFEENPLIDEIIVVTKPEAIIEAANLCTDYGIVKVKKIVCGGPTRLESSLNGVNEVGHDTELIAIHDGARPLVSQRVITDAVNEAAKFGAAIPGVGVKDTIKRAQGGVITATPDRAELYAVQTPQVFAADLIKGALQNALDKSLSITDDSMAVEQLGGQVRITEGSYDNFKITTPADVGAAEILLRKWEKADENRTRI